MTNFITKFQQGGVITGAAGIELTSRVVIGTVCIGGCKSNYDGIAPYVKPFFPPDPPQMTALYEFFVVLFARVSRFNHVFTL
jgi:hypothetical protein